MMQDRLETEVCIMNQICWGVRACLIYQPSNASKLPRRFTGRCKWMSRSVRREERKKERKKERKRGETTTKHGIKCVIHDVSIWTDLDLILPLPRRLYFTSVFLSAFYKHYSKDY